VNQLHSHRAAHDRRWRRSAQSANVHGQQRPYPAGIAQQQQSADDLVGPVIAEQAIGLFALMLAFLMLFS